MTINKDEIIMMPLKSIKPYKKNAKKHPKDQVEKIAKSIERFGFTVPVLVDGNNVVIAGHGRCLAAKMLQLEEVPCLIKDKWTEEEVKAYRLIDNKLNESIWDDALLSQELDDLTGVIDMSEFDFIFENQGDETYTKKVQTPIYEMKGIAPRLSEVFDMTKTKLLIGEIEDSALPDNEKKFLKLAAYRHIVFNYGLIAEYYANASKEMQELMEKSALVIIDFDKAIENGFVSANEDLKRLSGINYEE